MMLQIWMLTEAPKESRQRLARALGLPPDANAYAIASAANQRERDPSSDQDWIEKRAMVLMGEGMGRTRALFRARAERKEER